jgi:hypothetical protein
MFLFVAVTLMLIKVKEEMKSHEIPINHKPFAAPLF